MSLGRSEWPETGEMVVATVSRIESYGAYVTLDEYNNKEALLHISEISSRWYATFEIMLGKTRRLFSRFFASIPLKVR